MKETGHHTEAFAGFENIVLTADTICDAAGPAGHLSEHREKIRKISESLAIRGLSGRENANLAWTDLGILLNVVTGECGGARAFPLSLRPESAVCLGLDKHETAIRNAIAGFSHFRAEKLKQKAGPGRDNPKYTDRHRLLERAIRLIMGPLSREGGWPGGAAFGGRAVTHDDACLLIAVCYLDRSRLALPKGSSIPEKKLEALSKAWEWAEKSDVERARDVKMRIALERDRWDDSLPKTWIRAELEDWLAHRSVDLSDPLHRLVADRAGSHPDGSLISRELDAKLADMQIPKLDNASFDLPLFRARAAVRTWSPALDKKLMSAVMALAHTPLSSPLWEDTVALISHVRLSAPKSGWQNAAMLVWAFCERAEKRVRVSLQVRWYWSRYRDVYDLAVTAATELGRPKLAAFISDSLKSRPTVKLQNVEARLAEYRVTGMAIRKIKETGKVPENIATRLNKLKGKTYARESGFSEDAAKEIGEENFAAFKDIILDAVSDISRFRAYVEAEALFAAGEYVTGNEELKKLKPLAGPPRRNISDLPEGWAAIHLYVSEDSATKSRAFVVENRQCRSVEIDVSEVWRAFREWNAVRQGLDMAHEQFDKTLREVCAASGCMLKDVLSDVTCGNVLFVPHGFLHLVPLHASQTGDSRTGDGNYLFQEKNCLFLPAWSLAPRVTENAETSGDFLFTNWNCEDDIERLLNWSWSNSECVKNRGMDFFDAVREAACPPRLAVFYSHGRGDCANPYDTALMMHESPLTHRDILEKLRAGALSGTRVVLTACETDMVFGRFERHMTDEHLSLANAFLGRGASEVVGALYRCDADGAGDLIEKIKANPSRHLYELLKEQQNEWLEDEFYRVPMFRVMGFPP